MDGTRNRHGETRITYKLLVWKPERNRPFRSPRRRWEDSLKVDLK